MKNLPPKESPNRKLLKTQFWYKNILIIIHYYGSKITYSGQPVFGIAKKSILFSC